MDSKEDMAAVSNQTDKWFPLFLLQYEVLHFPAKAQRQLILENTRPLYTILCDTQKISIVQKYSFL